MRGAEFIKVATAAAGILSPIVGFAQGGWSNRCAITPILGQAAKVNGIAPIRVDISTSRPFKGRIVARMTEIGRVQTIVPLDVGSGEFRYDVPLMVAGRPQSSQAVVTVEDSFRAVVAQSKFDIVPVAAYNGLGICT